MHLAVLHELGLTAHNIETIYSKTNSNNSFTGKIDIKLDIEKELDIDLFSFIDTLTK